MARNYVQANPEVDPITNIIEDQLTEHHRRQFIEKFPQQIEQCMRLIGERLLLQLRDKSGDNHEDVCNLAIALERVSSVYKDSRAGR